MQNTTPYQPPKPNGKPILDFTWGDGQRVEIFAAGFDGWTGDADQQDTKTSTPTPVQTNAGRTPGLGNQRAMAGLMPEFPASSRRRNRRQPPLAAVPEQPTEPLDVADGPQPRG